MTKRLILTLLALLFTANAAADCCVELPKNKDGSIITGVLTAGFDPLGQSGPALVPFPFNALFLDLDTLSPTGDLTLVIPVDDENDFSDPSVALSAMDGFSTTEKWIASFVDDRREAGNIDFASVIAGHSVRLFEVNVSQFLFVTGVVRELVPNEDYIAVSVEGGNLAIIPTRPLKEMTNYMAVLTNDIRDIKGNDATPDNSYHLLKQQTPWLDENGKSTNSLVPDDFAAILESLRPLVNSWEAAAESAGVVREDIILSWPVQTQSITPVLKHLRSIARPAPTSVGPTGMTTSIIGGKGIADIYAGIITLPYYLGVPSMQNPIAPLTDFWKAKPGAYLSPFDASLSDKTSTHVTVANPFPVVTDMQTVPLLMTVPNEGSGHTKPAAGWPVVLFGHGLRGDRTQMLAMADSAAAAGYVAIGIDAPLHGLRPEDDSPLYIGNTPWAGEANERTFNVDYINNATGAPGPDGITDPTGVHMINLANLLATRDNARQVSADFSILTVTIPSISYDGDNLPDLDGSTIQFAAISGGAVVLQPFVAVEPMVNNAFLSVPMGGIARGLEASPAYGPEIRAGLEAAAGIKPGSADYEQFFLVWQTTFDSADPINWAGELSRHNNVVLHEVMGDQVNPNYVPTAPLSGTEPLIAALGLDSYSSSQADPKGLDVVGRFLPPAQHSSWLNPSYSPAATAEMQKQFASWIFSKGTAIAVEDAATMVPVVAVEMGGSSGLNEKSSSKKSKKKTVKPPYRTGESNGIQSGKTSRPTAKNRGGELR